MNRYLPLTALFLLGSLVFAYGQQSAKRSMAEKYYLYMDYAKAVPIYDELAKRALKDAAKGKPADWESVRRAAISNYHARNYKKAGNWYGSLDKNKNATKDDYLMYFESLRYQGKYDEAEKYLQLLKQTDPDQKKVDAYLRELNYYKKLMADSGEYKIKELPFNKGTGDFGPAFYDKGLVYASSRANTNIGRRYGWDNTFFLNAYYTEKSGDGFKKTGKLQRKGFKTQPHDGPVYFAKDGKTAFITRNRTEKDIRKGDVVKLGLYICEKGENDKWGVPQPFQYNDKAYSIGHAALSPDGKILYFASDMPGGQGGTDIWKCIREAGGWGKPQNLGAEINSAGNDLFPYVSPEGHLYFASDGYVGMGGLDVYEARRAGKKMFKPVNMGYPLNTQADDFGLITEAGGKMGYFSSDRTEYVDCVYGAVMNRRVFTLEGTVKAKNDSVAVIPGATVVLLNKTTGDSLVMTSDSSGMFYALLDKESEYEIVARKAKYDLVQPTAVSTLGLKESKDLTAELDLEPKRETVNEFNLLVSVKDCRGNDPVRNVGIRVKDLRTGTVTILKTDDKGELALGVLDVRALNAKPPVASVRAEYTLESAQGGYLSPVKKVVFTLSDAEMAEKVKRNEISLREESCIDKIKEGDKFELKDIYYDYNKATLRPESMVELEKAYEFLMSNPGIKVQLSSFTDSRGSDKYNLDLSQRRAQSCVAYLVQIKGLPAGRITAKGYGETQPINGCKNGVKCTEEEHQANRRTEIRVLKVNNNN